MHLLQGLVPLIGRILLTLIFFTSAIGKIGNWESTAGYMAAKGMPLPSFFLAGAILLLLGGSALVLSGYRARLGALLLLAFLVPATLIFHDFWAVADAERQAQMIQFMKNLGLMGGLSLIISHGAGSLSVDAKKKRKKG